MRIWNITHSGALKEQLAEDAMKQLPIPSNPAPFFYWHIERRKKRGKGWVFVRDLHGSKDRAAALFCKFFRDGQHRLRVMHKF